MNPSHSTGLHALMARIIFAKNRLTSARSSLGGVGAGVMAHIVLFFARAEMATDGNAACGVLR